MKIDPSYVLLMAMIVGVLGLVYAIASFVKNRTRQIEREKLESVLQAHEKGERPAPSAPAALNRQWTILQGTDAVPQPVASVKPAPPKPRPKALIAWIPPVSEGPPRFDQYITWPGAKTVTPVAERYPSEQDYVWD